MGFPGTAQKRLYSVDKDGEVRAPLTNKRLNCSKSRGYKYRNNEGDRQVSKRGIYMTFLHTTSCHSFYALLVLIMVTGG